VPDELTSVGRILRLPPIPDIPVPLRGRSFVVVQAIYIGDEDAGAELIRPLRDLGPEMDTVQTIPIAALSHLHMDPEHPVPGMADGLLLADLPAEAVDALVAVEGPDSGSPLLSVEVRHVGGELARVRPENGALAALDGRFMMFAVGITPTPEALEVVEAGVRRVQEALRPWDSGRMYLNFAEAAQSGQRLFGADAYHRLRAVKAQYDPEDVVRSNHPIPPARPVRQARRRAAERVAS
jgi:berberine-like enzyme